MFSVFPCNDFIPLLVSPSSPDICKKRLKSIGVSVRETAPDNKIAMLIVTANSLKRRPIMPGKKRIGIENCHQDSVIETMVKPISLGFPQSGVKGVLAFFPVADNIFHTTIASSTTKPTARVKAIRERLFKLKFNSRIIARVPNMDTGRARLAMAGGGNIARQIKR